VGLRQSDVLARIAPPRASTSHELCHSVKSLGLVRRIFKQPIRRLHFFLRLGDLCWLRRETLPLDPVSINVFRRGGTRRNIVELINPHGIDSHGSRTETKKSVATFAPSTSMHRISPYSYPNPLPPALASSGPAWNPSNPGFALPVVSPNSRSRHVDCLGCNGEATRSHTTLPIPWCRY
jgi:hypothetical protein